MAEPVAAVLAAEPLDIVAAAERVFDATDRRGIAQVVVDFASRWVDRAIFFDLTGPNVEVLAHRRAFPEDVPPPALSLPVADATLLSVIARGKQPAFGPMPNGQMYNRFLALAGLPRPPFVLLYPLLAYGKSVAVLYGDLAAPRPVEEFGDLQLLFKEAGTAWDLLGALVRG